jgi:hypothetical protein
VLLLLPKPIAVASFPLPEMTTDAVVFLAVTVSLPLLLIEALRKAGPLLMAVIRLPIVSSPVEV